MRRIDALYAIEREIKALAPGVRSAERQRKAAPLLDALRALASSLEQQTLPSGKLGEALAYLLKQWPKLIRYVEDDRLAIDTNLAENAIRPFALGRRNWLFADTVKGAKARASLFRTQRWLSCRPAFSFDRIDTISSQGFPCGALLAHEQFEWRPNPF